MNEPQPGNIFLVVIPRDHALKKVNSILVGNQVYEGTEDGKLKVYKIENAEREMFGWKIVSNGKIFSDNQCEIIG